MISNKVTMMMFNVKFVVSSLEQTYCRDVLENVLSPLNYPCSEPTVYVFDIGLWSKYSVTAFV